MLKRRHLIAATSLAGLGLPAIATAQPRNPAWPRTLNMGTAAPGGIGEQRAYGRDSETPLSQSALTALTDEAAERNNEISQV